jgi:hypothetical protein
LRTYQQLHKKLLYNAGIIYKYSEETDHYNGSGGGGGGGGGCLLLLFIHSPLQMSLLAGLGHITIHIQSFTYAK